MSVALITGSAGLIGSEAAMRFHAEGFDVVGVDNDMRAYFFGDEASTGSTCSRLQASLPRYTHEALDIRDGEGVGRVFQRLGRDIKLVVHAAAQPSHDWAAREPQTDFGINAVGTSNLLEAMRKHSPEAVFIFLSTNKVYGDRPNTLPLIEQDTRWSVNESHPFHLGIDETMSIDQCKHSLFGASKVAADILVQEYGRYYGMRTACFRGGCLTGPAHAGAELHGFLAYLMKCTVEQRPYRVFGYKGKQVRDNIHSADLIEAFWHFFQSPRSGEVYNMGGGQQSNCSMLEAIRLCEEISGKQLQWTYEEDNRIGDHIWWISEVAKFQAHYPLWRYQFDLRAILSQIHEACIGHGRS